MLFTKVDLLYVWDIRQTQTIGFPVIQFLKIWNIKNVMKKYSFTFWNMFSVHLNPFQNNFTKKTFISAAFKLRLSKKRRTLDSQNGLVLKYCNWEKKNLTLQLSFLDISISDPLFAGEHSYMSLTLESAVRFNTELSIEIRPDSLDGLIVHFGQSRDARWESVWPGG